MRETGMSNGRPLVAVTKAEGDEDIECAVSKAIDLIGGLDDLRNKRLIAIKPNLCCLKSPSSGATGRSSSPAGS